MREVKSKSMIRNDNISVKKESRDSCKRGYRKVVYISVRVRLCAATPASIIGNGTPPPPSQKHHFTHKHQINFCN